MSKRTKRHDWNRIGCDLLGNGVEDEVRHDVRVRIEQDEMAADESVFDVFRQLR